MASPHLRFCEDLTGRFLERRHPQPHDVTLRSPFLYVLSKPNISR